MTLRKPHNECSFGGTDSAEARISNCRTRIVRVGHQENSPETPCQLMIWKLIRSSIMDILMRGPEMDWYKSSPGREQNVQNHRVREAGRLGMRARPQVVTGEECAVLYTSLWACRPQSRRVTRPLWRRGGGERWCSNRIKKLWRGNQKCVKGNVIKFLLCEVRCDSSSISLGNILQTIHIKVRREGGREGSHLEATRSLG